MSGPRRTNRWGAEPQPEGRSPAATRQRRAGLADVRLWAAVLLLAGSAALGAWALRADEETVTVWRATRDLSVGAAAVDLETVEIDATLAAAGYLGPADDVSGALRWPVSAGELLPRGSVAGDQAPSTRRVTVPVDPLHAPVGLQAGDLVDAWVTPRSDAGASTVDAGLVLSGVAVAAVSADGVGLGGELGIVLDVPVADVPRVVAAARGGLLDLVAVPAGSQEPDL